MFHGRLDYFQKSPLGGRPNTKLGDHGTMNAHNRWFILFYRVWGPACIKIHWNSIGWGPSHIWLHTTLEGPWPHYMTLGVCWDGLSTLSFGLSQCHGHGSRFMCEAALRATSHMSQELWPCDGEDPWLSSKGRTMGVGKTVICSHMPSSIVWSENGPCCKPLHILLVEKEGRIWLNITCLKLYQFERINGRCCSS